MKQEKQSVSASVVGGGRFSWLRFGLMVAAIPAALAFVTVEARRVEQPPFRSRFAREPLRRLQRERPEFILIGNSMVFTRFHRPTLQELLAPRHATLFAYPGSASATWYLILKNYVAKARYRPHRVLLFFRHHELTAPRLRVNGKYAGRIASLMPSPDEVFEQKMVPGSEKPIVRLGYWLGQRAPLDRLKPLASKPLEAWTELSSRWFAQGMDEATRSRQVNQLFDFSNLRSPNEQQAEEAPEKFEQTVEGSFLPEILHIASEAHIPLTFIRIRPRGVAQGKAEDGDLVRYLSALDSYVTARGAQYIDMKTADWETADMFFDDVDHLIERRAPEYTRLFVEHMAPLFQ